MVIMEGILKNLLYCRSKMAYDNYFTLCEFLTPLLADGLSLESDDDFTPCEFFTPVLASDFSQES